MKMKHTRAAISALALAAVLGSVGEVAAQSVAGGSATGSGGLAVGTGSTASGNFSASADEVDEGLNPFEHRVYTRWLRPSGRVLLVGCGAGRDLIALHRLGYDVTGLEQSPDAAEKARQHLSRVGLTVPVIAAAVERAELDDEYDAIVFASSCYSNMRGSALRISTAFLARLRR